MKLIGRKLHAVLDYTSALLLIISPWIFNFSAVAPAKWVVIISGFLVFAVSVMTDYEGGLKKVLPMSAHLIIDIFAGIFIALSPWIFKFSAETYLFHVFFGLFSIAAGLLTTSEPESKQRHIPI